MIGSVLRDDWEGLHPGVNRYYLREELKRSQAHARLSRTPVTQ
jgi:hypothetical protein